MVPPPNASSVPAASDDLVLRPATASDVARLTEIVLVAYRRFVERLGAAPRPMTDDYAEVLRRLSVTVAESNNEIVGLIVVGRDEEGFFIDNVAIHPDHQRRGIGRRLFEHAEAAARQAGFDSIYLYTHERMVENLALYGRAGYVEYDRRAAGDARVVYLRKPLR